MTNLASTAGLIRNRHWRFGFMNGRGGVVTFFLFLFLSVIILLQILLMVQSDRFYDGLNRLGILSPAGNVKKIEN